MRIHVANRMTGVEDFNFPWFDRARDYLKSLGHDPVSPADMDRSIGFDGSGEPPPLTDCLRRDYAELIGCDAIAFGPEWAQSRGARAERQVAESIGLTCWRVDPDTDRFYREMAIALSGYARAGKDTVAHLLCEYGFERRAFANPIRDILAALDPLIGGGVRLSDPLSWHGWEGAKALPEVRSLLQRLGTEAGRRVLGEEVWVDALFRTPSTGRVVLSDTRFPNEADAVRARGGMVVRITRPGHGPINGHRSETALDGYDFDAEIFNDADLDDLRPQVEDLIDRITTERSPTHA